MSNAVAQPRWRGMLLELGVACGAAIAYFASCYLIKVKPLDRMGQVAALASLAYRLLLFAVPLIVALIVIAKHRPARWSLAVRLACAAFGGLASALLAGGVLAMLRGTSYGLGADTGDAVILAKWARALQHGEQVPGVYPPLQIYLLAWLADLQDIAPIHAIKSFQILGILVFGPAVYASWRLVLRPTWALGLGVVAALPLLEAYRQYPLLVLAVFIPLAIKFLETLRGAAEVAPRGLALRGALFGLGFGVLFLVYSGWFQWSAPGFLVTFLAVFPWRRGARQGAVLCGAALIVFAAVTALYLARVLAEPPIHDDYHYFDSSVEPMYIAMWRGGLPGLIGPMWPPIGELGGVGLFTVLLCAGWAAALALGARQTAVMATSWIMVGTWLLRLYYAHRMWQTKLVQLYPRTTAELLYCLTVLTGFAIYFHVERRAAQADDSSPLRSPWSVLGALCGIALLFASAGSALTDRYMPRDIGDDYGHLAFLAQITMSAGQNKAIGAVAEVGSATGAAEYAPAFAIDHDPSTAYQSALGGTPEREEWLAVRLHRSTKLSRVVLVPAGDGFPVDFTIDVWNGTGWLTRVSRQGYEPTPGPQSFAWAPQDFTGLVRVHATRLGRIGERYGLRIAEFEIYE